MIDCPRERDVVDTLMRGEWEADEAAELREHAKGCLACAETIDVSRVLRADQLEVVNAARVPTAGLVWWRATIRARAEAVRVAEQPMTVAQAVGAAAILGLIVALAGVVWRTVPELPQPGLLALLLIGVAVCVVVAPLAVVFALARD
jgi:hypothetical protein